VPPGAAVTADASYSGKPGTIPSAMLDGNPATAWSNYYLKAATALLPAFSLAHEREWVSVAWQDARTVSSLRPTYVVDATRALPAAVAVRYWNGGAWAAVSNPHVALASASGEPSEITFDPVSTTKLRLDMTSAHPKAGDGFLAISTLDVPGGALH
jgi:beta-galactosidase